MFAKNTIVLQAIVGWVEP